MSRNAKRLLFKYKVMERPPTNSSNTQNQNLKKSEEMDLDDLAREFNREEMKKDHE